ncbi:MAG TPA: VWA domain-containing protein, partial [Gaiellales bacterium]|nr:VWA domain-containing protein [Gaiellales bacterium]
MQLVRLDVRVTDEQGRPIRDLRRSEVQVLENGRPRPILFFQHIRQPTEPYLEAARHTIGGEVSTNQGAPRGHLYVFVFDQNHLSPAGMLQARKAADQFLRTKLRPGDRVAIYGLPAPGPHLTFTGDRLLAERELMGVHGDGQTIGLGGLGAIRVAEAYQILRGNELVLARVVAGQSQAAGSNQNLLFDVPRANLDDPTVFREMVVQDARTVVSQADQQTRQFLDSLADLISGLSLIEGRKTVILFSDGFFDDNVSGALERVSAAAARSYAVIEAMDMNNRSVTPTRVTSGLGNDRGIEVADQIAPLSALAVATDGRFYPDAGGWLDRSLDSLAAQSQDYYLVGFEPSPNAVGQRDGYYPVTVRVTRPGVHVSTRTGFALAPQPTPNDRRRSINAALNAPFPAQDLPVHYTTYQLRGTSIDRQRVVLAVSTQLPIASPGKSRADVVFVVREATSGRVVASGTDTMALPAHAAPGTTSGTATYEVQFDVPPGDYLMRVIVRSPDGL